LGNNSWNLSGILVGIEFGYPEIEIIYEGWRNSLIPAEIRNEIKVGFKVR
jgi:hypothetical protein